MASCSPSSGGIKLDTAKAVAMGGPSANITAVMSGQVDIGWAAPPFGLDQLDKGDIRMIATGNDAAVFNGQTVRVNIANANYLKEHQDVVDRYMKAYRETVDFMYRRPEGDRDLFELDQHHAGEGQAHARRLLQMAGNRSGQDRRARSDRERRGGIEVHRAAADERATRGIDPYSAEVSALNTNGPPFGGSFDADLKPHSPVGSRSTARCPRRTSAPLM